MTAADAARPGDGIDKLHDQLLAAGVTGMRYHRSSDGWGSSISVPRNRADVVLELWGYRPTKPPPEAEQFYALCLECGRRYGKAMAGMIEKALIEQDRARRIRGGDDIAGAL